MILENEDKYINETIYLDENISIDYNKNIILNAHKDDYKFKMFINKYINYIYNLNNKCPNFFEIKKEINLFNKENFKEIYKDRDKIKELYYIIYNKYSIKNYVINNYYNELYEMIKELIIL